MGGCYWCTSISQTERTHDFYLSTSVCTFSGVCLKKDYFWMNLSFFIKKINLSFFVAAGVPSPKELDHSADFTEPKTLTKNTKAKKPKPKKRARPKLTIETPEVYEDDRTEEELPPDSADTPCETPGGPSPNKGKKSRGAKKKRKSTITTPPKTKFEFPDVTSQDESFSENSSVSPNDIAKEVAAIAARKQLETAQKNNKEASSDVDDEVFASNHDERDGLSLLAFASVDKTAKRRRSDAPSPSEDSSLKKRGRPKKPSESPTFDSGKGG